MDFPGLIADFAARHNVAGLAAKDGAAINRQESRFNPSRPLSFPLCR